MERQRTFSGAPWEEQVGYCRAVRAGDHVYVTGTAPMNDDGTVHEPGDGYAQAKRCFEIIREALDELNASLADVVRTRMYVTDINHWEEVARVHGEFFGDIRPASTMVEVSRLIDPELLVEIEADAVVT